jgi:hypothetical protein
MVVPRAAPLSRFARRAATELSRTGCLSAIFLASWAAAFSAAPASREPHPSGVAWEERIKVASGAAYQGPWRMNESQFLYVDDPTVAINEEKVVAVAWADQSRKDIFLQIYEPEGQRRFGRRSMSPGARTFFPGCRGCTSPLAMRAKWRSSGRRSSFPAARMAGRSPSRARPMADGPSAIR